MFPVAVHLRRRFSAA